MRFHSIGDEPPRLLPTGEVHLYWRRPRFAPDELRALSEHERSRAARFRFPADRESFIAAHALTRFALAEITGIAAADLEFSSGAHGKPEVANPLSRRLGFNLSHTRDLVAFAAAWDCQVGIDVERADRKMEPSLQSIVLSEGERGSGLGFIEYWTWKEAYLKGLGVGLIDRIHELEIEKVEDGWLFHRMQPTPHHWLAAAARLSTGSWA